MPSNTFTKGDEVVTIAVRAPAYHFRCGGKITSGTYEESDNYPESIQGMSYATCMKCGQTSEFSPRLEWVGVESEEQAREVITLLLKDGYLPEDTDAASND